MLRSLNNSAGLHYSVNFRERSTRRRVIKVNFRQAAPVVICTGTGIKNNEITFDADAMLNEYNNTMNVFVLCDKLGSFSLFYTERRSFMFLS